MVRLDLLGPRALLALRAQLGQQVLRDQLALWVGLIMLMVVPLGLFMGAFSLLMLVV